MKLPADHDVLTLGRLGRRELHLEQVPREEVPPEDHLAVSRPQGVAGRMQPLQGESGLPCLPRPLYRRRSSSWPGCASRMTPSVRGSSCGCHPLSATPWSEPEPKEKRRQRKGEVEREGGREGE